MLDIPCEHIDLVLVNSNSVGFEYIPLHGDLVSLYPEFESFDISSLTRVRTTPLRHPRFILDVHLGKLARLLRLFGFDVLYRTDYGDSELNTIALQEGRTLLSRDRRLIEENGSRAFFIRNQHPADQLKAVLQRFDLSRQTVPFSRCLQCNSVLEQVSKEDVKDSIPPLIRQTIDDYRYCALCDKVFWKGSHYKAMEKYIHKTLHAIDANQNVTLTNHV
jgi:hypothetical protein